jgi:sulfoxide reductase heme-binding subunit YedZ
MNRSSAGTFAVCVAYPLERKTFQAARGENGGRTMNLRSKALNGWRLFALIAIPICLVIGTAMLKVDLGSAEEISSLIQLSVRCSVPWLYLAFAASSLQLLFPNTFTRWLMRNRRIIGLCFAGGMAWQLLFIVWMVTGFYRYYADEVYLFGDIIVQIPGYLFLIAMTLTSFMPVRRRLSSKQWRTLHTTGAYFLWGTVWSTYWYELYYYDDIQLIDYLYYWAGFVAWGLRIWAWSRLQLRLATS